MDNQKTLAAVFVMTLERFDNMTLAVLNNSIQTFGRVDIHSLAYKPALDATIIKESGEPFELESLRDAAAFEVNRRVEAGTFN